MRELLECGRAVKRICRFHRDTIMPTNHSRRFFHETGEIGNRILNQSVGF